MSCSQHILRRERKTTSHQTNWTEDSIRFEPSHKEEGDDPPSPLLSGVGSIYHRNSSLLHITQYRTFDIKKDTLGGTANSQIGNVVMRLLTPLPHILTWLRTCHLSFFPHQFAILHQFIQAPFNFKKTANGIHFPVIECSNEGQVPNFPQ